MIKASTRNGKKISSLREENQSLRQQRDRILQIIKESPPASHDEAG